MQTFIDLFIQTLIQVGVTFLHNWPFLILSILISVLLKLYIDPQKVSAFLLRHRGAGVVGATAAAVATPLCSCGTTAIILGMMSSMMPWAPIVAFMVASPLTSPEELIYSAGLFGWPFALTFFGASIVLGLAGGAAAALLEKRGWLANQSRFVEPQKAAVEPPVEERRAAIQIPSRGKVFAAETSACACGQPAQAQARVNAIPARRIPAAVVGAASEAAASNFGAASVWALPPALSGESIGSGCSTCGSGALDTSIAASSVCGCGSEGLTVRQSVLPPAIQPALQTASCCSASAGSISARNTAFTASSRGKAPGASERENGARAWDAVTGFVRRLTGPGLRPFLKETLVTGRRLVLMFAGFAFIGYFLNGLIPEAWVAAFFGAGNVYSVPLAATLGVPLYINTEGSLPLVRALIDGGMSQGAALAFLITGSGTSFGAIAGALTIARWRVIVLVIGTLWVGAVVIGMLYDLMLAAI